MFSCEICETYKKNYFEEHPQMAASVTWIFQLVALLIPCILSDILVMARPQTGVPNTLLLPHFIDKHLTIVVFLVWLNILKKLPTSIKK